jgi:hypothetical protein
MDPEVVERVEELRAPYGGLERARLGSGRFVLVEGPAARRTRRLRPVRHQMQAG